VCFHNVKLVKVAIVGNSHGIRMVMHISLRTADQQFSLYKLIVLPTQISKDKFIKYYPDFLYFWLSFSQRDYILMKTEGLQRCTTGGVVVCPVNVALFDS
jgi:3-polyprenyl-4-hydroxybenzoate decarboxylase